MAQRPSVRRPLPRAFLIEELEPRVLFSADADAVWVGGPGQPLDAPPQAIVQSAPAMGTEDRSGSHALPAEGAGGREVVFLDASVPDAADWLAALQAQAQETGRSIEVIRLDARQDGLEQVSAALADRQGVSAVHIISHGDASGMVLGSARLDADNLMRQAGAVSGWAAALTADADLLLYGCDLASGESGRALIADLALLTGADVAASDDPTGSALRGGDWVLEHQTGQIETALAVTTRFQAEWQQVLATATFQQGASGYSGTQDAVIRQDTPTTADGTAGNLTMLQADDVGEAKQTLLRFDSLFNNAGGSIPAYSSITSATLQLRITEDGTGSAFLHRILSSNWTEASTWNSLVNGISLDGVEAASTADGSVDMSTNNTFVTFDVTSTVQAWANGATNLGWLIYTDGNEAGFASSENTDPTFRPLLTINYATATPPALDLNGATAGTSYSATYTENTPINVTAGTATVTAGTNSVSANLSGMTVTITNIQNAGLETLTATVTGTNITSSYNSATGVLTLSGSDTAANYEQVLRSIQYDNSSNTPNTTARTISFVATDPYGGNSAAVTTTLNITAVNDAPVITSNGGGASAAINVQENTTAVTTATSTDGEGTARTYSLSGADAARFSINSTTGVLTFASAPDFENPQDAGADNVYNVNVVASDGTDSDTQALTVTVTDVSSALVVDTVADTNDTGLGSSFTAEQLNASKGVDGKVSLREAIIAANGTAGLDTVTFAITGATGAYGEYTINMTSTLPTITDAIHLNAASQPGYTTRPVIVLDGNSGSGSAFTLSNTADGSTIRGFVIRDFAADGIHIQSGSDNHTIVGNYIGSFNADGSFAGATEENASEGIESYGANVLIGGTTTADRNVISGNGSAYNIYLATGANGTIIRGNHIGTNAAGTSVFANNSTHGIMVENSATNITIGGTASGAGNVISGFTSRGIWFTTTGTATIQGNKIGTDVTGTVDLGNGEYGLYLDDGGSAVVGGTVANAGNLISGNNGGGIYAGNTGGVTIQGNIIGLNASGTAALANTGVGIYLNTSAASTVGGNDAAARNVISGNTSHGLAIHSSPASGHVIKGNYIGVGSDGTTLLGNGGSGIYIAASNHVIGGKTAGDGNVIAGNAGAGINVASGNGNLFYRNSIHSNTGLGVDLDNDGVTVNDSNDGDGGANYRNNFPVITSVVTEGGTTRIVGSIDFYNGQPIYIEFFSNTAVDASGYGEGRTYLGSVMVTANSLGDASFSLDVSGVSVGDWITAIANVESTYIGASEFAYAVQAVAPANGPRGKLIWNINDQFYQAYADWNGTSFSQTGTNGLAYGDDISMILAAEAPTREEIIFIGSADVSGKILAGVWNGSTWSSVISIPVASPSAAASQYNSFAVQYDEVTGNAMLVWDNGNTGTTGLSYATWDGSSWSAINTITAPVAGEPVHMKLAAHPSSQQMILAVSTAAASNNQYALVWNGSSWGNAQTLGTNSSKQYFEINVAYESQSGQAMVIYDASAANGSAIQYRTWDGSNWSGEATLAVPTGVTSASELHTTVLTSDPTSNRLALAAKNAANEVWLHVWDGSAWDSGLLATASGVTLTDHHATMDLAFESQSGHLLAAYGQAAGPSVFYRTWTSGSGWSAQQTGPSMGATDVPYVVKLYADPYTDTIMLGVQDAAADLNLVAWSGSSWGSVNTLDSATGFTYRESFTFVWYRNAAVIANVDGDSFTYLEGSGAVVIDQGGNGTVTMDAGGSYDGASLGVSFLSGSTAGEDVLSVRHQGSGAGQIGVSGANVSYQGVLIGTVSGGSGGTPLSITLNASASDAAVTALLRNITYENTDTETPDTTARVVRFQLTSAGGQASGASDVTVSVQAVNDAPVNSVPGAQSVNEDASLTFSSGNGNALSLNDVDAASGNLQVQLSVLNGTLTVPSWSATAASSITLTGTLAQLQAHLASVVYAPAANHEGSDTLTMVTSDLGNTGSGGALLDTDQVAITVNPVNDAPVITSNGGGASASINVAEGGTAVTTVTATDVDAGATLSYSISGGADAARFSIDASTGALTFNTAPDREAPTDANADNIYNVVVSVSDGSQTDTQTLAVTVTDLNDTAPVITSDGGGASASINVAEGSTAVTTVTATDLDATGSLTYSISGGADAARFSINSATGALTFNTAPDREAPTDANADNVYDVVVTVSDGTQSDVQTLAVTVTDLNDTAPVITSDGGGASASLNVAEGSAAVTTVTATDLDTTGTLTYSISGGADAARFSINSATGALTFNTAPDREAPTDANADNVYDVVVTVSDDTQSDVQTLAVTVTDLNDTAPVITSDGGGASASVNVAEGSTAVTTVTSTDADLTGTLTYSISGGADAARFSINSATGALTFNTAPDREAPTDANMDNVYDVVVTVSDGAQTDAQTLSVTVTDLNDTAPVITSDGGGASASINVAEGSTAVTTVTASDADLTGTLTYSISGGADAGRFSIDASTGALTFNTAPDREAPTDANADNVYDIIVTVSDGTQSDVQTLAVTVTDLNDTAPVITSDGGGASASINVAEGSTAVTTVTASDADLTGTLTYSISGGADAGRFSIDASTGALTFNTAPDREAPTDANADNVYDIIVTVSDGTQTDVQTLAVTVTDQNDTAPVITSDGGGASASINVAEGSTTVTTVTVTDADLTGTLTYSISGGADAGRFSIDSSTGALTFNTAPDREAPTDANADNVYNVVVTVSDGSQTDTQTLAVTVTDLNDTAPVITSDGGGASASVNVAEGSTAVTTVTATDADLTGTLTYSISGGADAGHFSIDSSTGALTFNTAADREAPTDANADNVYDVVVTVSDGTQSDVQTLAVTVTDLNDTAPVITSDGGGTSASVNVTEGGTTVTTVTATDLDTTGTLTYSISGGADAGRFSIDSTTGALTFNIAPDREAPTDANADNVYDVVVTVSDGSQTDTQTLAVTVTDLNDTAPVITSNGGGASASVNVAEGGTAVTTVTATDLDTTGTLSYSISGGADAARFSIESSTGALTFNTAPDHEAPTDANADNVYDVTVTVSDGTQTDVQTLMVTVTDLNDTAPTITSNGGGASASINVAEGSTAVTTVTATDIDTTGTLTYSISGGADAGRFSIDSLTGELRFTAPPDFEAPGDANADNTYDVVVSVSDGSQVDTQSLSVAVADLSDSTPVIQSDGGGASAAVVAPENSLAVTTVLATDADAGSTIVYAISGGADAARFSIDAATGVLTFSSAPDHEAPNDADTDNVYEVVVTASDGVNSDVQTLSVSVADVNEVPVWMGALPMQVTQSGATLSVPASAGLLSLASDPDASPLQVVLMSGPSHGSLQINADGSFVYVAQAGYVGMDGFSVALSDGSLTGAPQAVSVRVDAAPVQAAPPVVLLPAEPSTPAVVEPAPEPQRQQPPAPDAEPEQASPEVVAAVSSESAALPVVLPDTFVVVPEEATAAGRAAPTASAMPSADPAGNQAFGMRWAIQAVDLADQGVSPLQVLAKAIAGGGGTLADGPGSSGDAAPRLIELGEVSAWPPDAGLADAAVDAQLIQAGGTVLSAGAVWWAARTSGLLASMAISAPVWRGIDPLPVLGREREDEGAEAVEGDVDVDVDAAVDGEGALAGADHELDRRADALFQGVRRRGFDGDIG